MLERHPERWRLFIQMRCQVCGKKVHYARFRFHARDENEKPYVLLTCRECAPAVEKYIRVKLAEVSQTEQGRPASS